MGSAHLLRELSVAREPWPLLIVDGVYFAVVTIEAARNWSALLIASGEDVFCLSPGHVNNSVHTRRHGKHSTACKVRVCAG